MKMITISVLILLLSFVSIFCCCLTGTAQAGMHYKAERSQIAESQCCQDKTNNVDSEKNRECKCEKGAEFLAIKGFNLSKAVDSLGRLLNMALSFAEKIDVSCQKLSQNYVLRMSNQIVKNDPPIYLQDSILRL